MSPASLCVAVDGSGLARPAAGVGTYTAEILRALARERPTSRLVVYARSQPDLGGAGLEWRRLPSLRLVGRHLLWPVQLRRLGADLYFGPAGTLPLAPLPMPSVLTVHDLAIYRHPEWFPPGQPLSVHWVVPRSLARAERLIAVSRSTAADLSELFGIPPERVEVVPEGVADRYQPLGPPKLEEAARRLDLTPGFVLFVGTIEPRKNLGTLLDAWSRMRERPPLVVAGTWGWRCGAVRARLETTPGVRLLGSVAPQQLPLLYNLAGCLAHPAWYEGFGLTPLEAMACGTPVVTSGTSSLPEVVGDAGLAVDPSDVEGWTDALERACQDEDLRRELSRRGRERAAGFTWERAARATWEVMDRVVAAASGSAESPSQPGARGAVPRPRESPPGRAEGTRP
jgi:glycosyltransferase involved in cell wall biosynthesis